MQDITHYSDNELSLIVFNDETFYNMRSHIGSLIAFLKEFFIFTNSQLEILKADIEEDKEEA